MIRGSRELSLTPDIKDEVMDVWFEAQKREYVGTVRVVFALHFRQPTTAQPVPKEHLRGRA